ncbi:MAG TPA: 4Fe-4S dicluster domain-containing protein [Anaerolineae bacterium]|nr:4Fe-4S dicluster domain-containing protein [Anaerolineae bacterium]
MRKTAGRDAAASPTATKRRKRRGRITIFPNWCKGCGLCVEFCPMEVLEQAEDGRVIAARPERCTACGWCELHCPDFAIFVTEIGPEGEG